MQNINIDLLLQRKLDKVIAFNIADKLIIQYEKRKKTAE